MIRHLRYRPSLTIGLLIMLASAAVASLLVRPVTAALIGWDCGVLAYATTFLVVAARTSTDRLKQVAGLLDGGRWAILTITLAAALASLGAIVAELAHMHGKPHAVWLDALAGGTVLLSWVFVHLIFATHYAHDFWREGGLSFPGNDKPNYTEFLYFSFCMAVASQVSDVSTQSASMRQLVLAHSLVSYLFNTAIIALGVNIAASLAG